MNVDPRQVEELFYEALGLEPQERDAFVARLRASDPVLGAELESLFVAHEKEGDLLDSPAFEVAAELILDSSPELPNGYIISRYEIVTPLGKGGMGNVYLAKDRSLNRKVALKFLSTKVTYNKNGLRRFKQEAMLASSLNHPNIITMHEIGEEDGLEFIAMEYIEGQTLRKRLTQSRITIAELLELTIQVAEALSAAHTAGITHRDIKPENIMVRADGYVKVLDFGLAKLSDFSPTSPPPSGSHVTPFTQSATEPGTLMGTVNYMSPEQARGLVVDARTDIFSLGVVMYEMATGRLPFCGETNLDVLVKILEKDPVALTEFREKAPADLERIVNKAMNKEREQRYQTAEDLLSELKRLKEDLEFKAKLERSSAPIRDQGKPVLEIREAHTQVFATDKTIDESAMVPLRTGMVPSTLSSKYIGGRLRGHKREFLTVLLFLTLAVVGFSWWYFSNRTGHKKRIESIAVLPFINESGDDLEYLSDGMTETLINNLSHLQNISVKARSSVFRYKGKEVDPKQVGSELNVQALLNGRVVLRGDQLTLSLELVDTRTGNQIWGGQYNRKMSDLQALQSEFARDVSNKLRVKLSGADEQRLIKDYTENAEAYQLYLKGRFYWNKRTPKDFQKSIEYFNQAVSLDPDNALAYAGLADSYTLLSIFDAVQPREGMPKAREYALKSISLDGNLAEPHATLGLILTQYYYDFALAEREYKRAIELNPNYPQAHQWYGQMLGYQGRFEEGVTETRRALEFDPLSLPINWNYGLSLYYARKYDECIEQLKKTLELDNNFRAARISLGQAYQAKGRYADSVEEYAKSEELLGEFQNAKAMRGSFGGGWRSFLRAVTSEPRRYSLWPIIFTAFQVELGEKGKALAELDAAYAARKSDIRLLKIEPLLDGLRPDPRFQELLRKIGLQPLI